MNPITFDFAAAWEKSGLTGGSFVQLIRDLEADGRARRGRTTVTFSSLRVAEFAIGGRPRRPARRRRT